MKITNELAANILDHIEKTPRLYNNLEYLLNYTFTGFENIKGKTIGVYIYSINGFVELCKKEIFVDDIQMYNGESDEELVERLSAYAINYLTCVAAIDMFINKFKDQYFNVQHIAARLAESEYSVYLTNIKFLISDLIGSIIPCYIFLTMESDDYKLVDKALDRKLKIDVLRYGHSDYKQYHIKVNELSKDRLEEMMVGAG